VGDSKDGRSVGDVLRNVKKNPDTHPGFTHVTESLFKFDCFFSIPLNVHERVP